MRGLSKARGQADRTSADSPDKVISLIRVSTKEQALEDRAGIPAQRTAIEGICKRHRLEVPPGWAFEIAGVSGCAVSVTPEWARILRIIRGEECRGLTLKEESRLMRPDNMEDLGILEQFKKHNVKIYLPDTVFDLRNPSDWLHSLIRFGFSGYERGIIRDRMLLGKVEKLKKGEWIFGNNVPYGMKLVEKDKRSFLGVDENTIGHIKELFRLRLKGVTSRTELVRRIPSIKYSNIPRYLRNENYTGYFVTKNEADPDKIERKHNGSIKCQKRIVLPEDQWERFWVMEPGATAPISMADYQAVQRLLDVGTHQRIRHVKEREYTFLYRGLIRCECGRAVQSVRRSDPKANFHKGYYMCHGGGRVKHPSKKVVACASRRMRRDILEPMLDRIVADYFSDPEFFSKAVKNQQLALNRRDERAIEIDRLQREIKSTEEAIRVNRAALQRGKLAESEHDQEYDQFMREIQAAKIALHDIGMQDVDAVPPKAWMQFALRFKRWKKLSFKERRELLVSVAPIFRVAAYKVDGKKRPRIVISECTISLTGQKVDLYDENYPDIDAGDEIALATSGRHSSMSALNSQYSISIPLNSLQV